MLIVCKLEEANGKWRNEVSDFSKIGNNCFKQGAVLSAVHYCVSTDDPFKELHPVNIGCCICQKGYADDLIPNVTES